MAQQNKAAKRLAKERNGQILEALRQSQGERVTLRGKQGAWLKLYVIGSLSEIIRGAARKACCGPLTFGQVETIAAWLSHKGYRVAKKNARNTYDHYILLEEAELPATP